FGLNFSPQVQFHSIIADINNPPGPRGTDGVVPYSSSHLDGVSSELIIPGGHLCQANSLTIDECKRILTEHPASSAMDPSGPRRMAKSDSATRQSVRVQDLGQGAPPARSLVAGQGGHWEERAEAPTHAQ